MRRPTTLGELKASGYRPRSVKQEIRDNLRARIKSGGPLFPGILGYDRTVTNTGALKWSYMNKIMQSWHENGLHSAAEIESGDPRRRP